MFNRTKQAVLICVILTIVSGALWVGASTTGIVTGVVKSAKDSAVLSGVNIIVEGTSLSTVTDSDGRFVITNVPPGDYEVRAELVGYAAETVGGVQVTMDEKSDVTIQLKEEATQEKEVVVTRSRPMVAPDVVNTLNLVTAQQEPLTRLDPTNIRTATGLLSAVPGVVAETSGSGQMHVRGGRANQTGWYLEGIPITDPNTAGFGTNLYTTGMSRFQAYTGGFGAEYGNATCGVLNEVKKTGADSPGVRLGLEGGNTAYRDGAIEFGGGSADAFNFYVSAAAQGTDLDGPILKRQDYNDTVAKLVWPSKDNTFTVLAMQGTVLGKLDFYHDTGDRGAATPHEHDYMQQRYAVSAVTWSHNFSPESFITVRPYYLKTDAEYNLATYYSGYYSQFDSERTGLQVNYTGQLGSRHLLKVGGSYQASDNNYYLYPGFQLFRADVNTSQNDLYVQDQIKLADKWTFDAGLRRESMTYDRTGGEFVPGAGYTGAALTDVTEAKTSPRMGLAFAADERTVWKVNWGKYAKFAPASSVQHVYFDDPTGPGSTILEAMVTGLGSSAAETSTAMELSLEKQLSDTLAMRVTPFTATFNNLGDNYTDPNTGVMSYTNLGEGKSSGVELMFRKRMANNWQGWLSYTYQRARSNRADYGYLSDMYYTSWDQRHTLSLVTDLKSGHFTHTVRADYGSGRADLGDPTLQERASPSFMLSYGLAVDLPKGSGIGDALYVSVFNVLNNQQTMQYRWDGPTRVMDSWAPSRFISMGVTRKF